MKRRSAVYAKKNPSYRIASVANDEWQLQHHEGGDGTKTRDPWCSMSPRMSREEAEAALSRHDHA